MVGRGPVGAKPVEFGKKTRVQQQIRFSVRLWHHGLKHKGYPFSCEICEKGYSRRAQFERHLIGGRHIKKAKELGAFLLIQWTLFYIGSFLWIGLTIESNAMVWPDFGQDIRFFQFLGMKWRRTEEIQIVHCQESATNCEMKTRFAEKKRITRFHQPQCIWCSSFCLNSHYFWVSWNSHCATCRAKWTRDQREVQTHVWDMWQEILPEPRLQTTQRTSSRGEKRSGEAQKHRGHLAIVFAPQTKSFTAVLSWSWQKKKKMAGRFSKQKGLSESHCCYRCHGGWKSSDSKVSNLTQTWLHLACCRAASTLISALCFSVLEMLQEVCDEEAIGEAHGRPSDGRQVHLFRLWQRCEELRTLFFWRGCLSELPRSPTYNTHSQKRHTYRNHPSIRHTFFDQNLSIKRGGAPYTWVWGLYLILSWQDLNLCKND